MNSSMDVVMAVRQLLLWAMQKGTSGATIACTLTLLPFFAMSKQPFLGSSGISTEIWKTTNHLYLTQDQTIALCVCVTLELTLLVFFFTKRLTLMHTRGG